LLPSGSDSRDFCSKGFLAVPFVASAVYDTVVLYALSFALREPNFALIGGSPAKAS
jgi:hypothetical protein